MLSHALKTQREILKKYEEENSASFKRMAELYSSGHFLTMKGTLRGPYTIMNHYYFDDGSCITTVTPASLSWAPIPLVIY